MEVLGAFSTLLEALERIIPASAHMREMSLVKTHLQTASLLTVRALSTAEDFNEEAVRAPLNAEAARIRKENAP
jgi:hypothetical protein